ncbi:MAG: zinc ribbon domain-containing protein [Acidimicrobiales bacterium]
MTDPFAGLLELQDHDTRIGQLRHRLATLPDKVELAAVQARLADLDARMATVRAERDQHGARQAGLEQQIEASKARKGELEQRMYGGQVTAARDLQAMDEEVRHLVRHIAELEDRELEVMEVIEPLDGDLHVAAAEHESLDAEGRRLRAAIAVAQSGLDAEIAAELAGRDAVAADIPSDLLARYEKLRAKLGGTGAARLTGGSCSGCHLVLPAMEVDRIKKAPPDAVVSCDNCGRILVR